MYKAYKFRLYPSNKQKEMIHKTFGCSGLVYNHYLGFVKNMVIKKPMICVKV